MSRVLVSIRSRTQASERGSDRLNKFAASSSRLGTLLEGPVERPKLKFERTFSFSRYNFFYDSRAIKDNKGVIALDVGTREDEHRPGFYVVVVVMKYFATACFNNTVWSTQNSGDICSCADAILNCGDIPLAQLFAIVSADKGAS